MDIIKHTVLYSAHVWLSWKFDYDQFPNVEKFFQLKIKLTVK